MPPLPIRSLLSGSLIYGLGGVLSKVIPLLLLPLYTAHLAPADYGVVSLLQLSGSFLSSVLTFGFGTSVGVLYFPENSESGRERIIASAFWVLLISAFAMAGSVILLAPGIGQLLFDSAVYTTHVALAGAATALSMIAQPLQLRLQFAQRPVQYVAATLSSVVVTAGVGVAAVIWGEMGALGLVWAWVVGQASLVIVLSIPNRSIFHLAWVRNVVRELLRNGWPMIPSFFFLFVIQEGVRYPLQWFVGLEAVGVYAIGASLGMGLGVFTNAFISAWTPFALSYASDATRAPAVLGRVTYAYIVVFGLAVVAAFYFAYPVVYLLVEPRFFGAAPVVGLCAGASYFSALFLMLLPPAYFAREPQCVTRVQALSAVVASVLAAMLIPRFGAVGAGLAVVLSTLSMAVFQYLWNVVMRRDAYVQIIYPRTRIVLYLLFVAGLGLAAWPMMNAFHGREWSVAVAVVASAAAVALIGFLGPGELRALRDLLAKRRAVQESTD